MPIVFCSLWVWKICKQESAPNKKGRWVVSLFFEGAGRLSPPNKKCNLDEAMIHFTSYNAAAQPRWVGKAGPGGGPRGPRRGRLHRHVHQTAWTHSQHPCVQNCRRGVIFFGGGRGNKPGELVLELVATLQQLVFEGEAPGNLWVAWHQCWDGMDSLRWTDGGLKDLSIWDNLSGLNAFECFFAEAAWFWFLFWNAACWVISGVHLIFCFAIWQPSMFSTLKLWLAHVSCEACWYSSWKRAIYTP